VRLRLLCALLLSAGSLPLAAPLAAQQNPELEKQRRRLDEIRQERERLQRQQQQIEGQVSDVGSQLRNLERRREATTLLVTGIEREISSLGSQLERTSAELTLTQDNLADRRAVLQRRLVDIYKRGPLYTWRVLLAAESFGDLLSRYKYLYLTSRQDRSLLTDVQRLNDRIATQRTQLRDVLSQLDNRRAEREAELKRFGVLAAERETRLKRIQRTTQEAAERISTLERDESRLNEVLAALERRRSSRPAMRGVPRERRAISLAPSGVMPMPSTRAPRLTICSSSASE